MPRSVGEIDFSPLPGKTYWNVDREWREEFIYFLLVDRFHDGRRRISSSGSGRARGSGNSDQLRRFAGGTLEGITRNLGYIQDLGCSAIWLSPIFENDGAPDPASSSYHGYAIRNYLEIDPRFGTKAQFVDLVDQAHRRGLRVFLDAVANHSGDVFAYDQDPRYFSDDARRYDIRGWRHSDYPIPIELRNPDCYHRRGQIRDSGWDSFPETQWGDFFVLKGFYNEDDPAGLAMQQILIDAHRYWIREADIDGYRMDAVKHMGELAVARFAQAMREYAYALGKRDFFLFGELIGGDDAINRYAGPNTEGQRGDRTVFYGLNSVLDFPLYWVLPGVIRGADSPANLFHRYDSLRERAISRGDLGRYLVTFIDNHDQVGQNWKRRFAVGLKDEQVVAAIGYLLCALGTPCIYYGTEQGFAGEGPSDAFIREAMFDLDDAGRDRLNRECAIYRSIAAIAKVFAGRPALRFGRMYFRETSSGGEPFGLATSHPCTLAFSRILADEEVLVAYNTSDSEGRRESVIVDASLHAPGQLLSFLYGGEGGVTVQAGPGGARFVDLALAPMQFVILGR